MDPSIPTEGPHHHALARFLRIATEQRLASPEAALAEAMGKEFFPADVQAYWRTVYRDDLAEEAKGEWLVPRRGAWHSAPVIEIPTINWLEISPTGDYKLARASTNDIEAFKIIKNRHTEGSQELEIIFRRVGSELPVQRITDFRRNITGATVLFQAFMSLKAARLSPSPRTNHDSFSQHLETARRDIARFISYSGTGELIEQEVELVIQEMFGLGWDIQNVTISKTPGALPAFANRVREAKANGSLKLKLLSAILGAVQEEKPAPFEGLDKNDVILEAIAHWTYLHARFRSLNSSNLRQSEDLRRAEIREGLANLPIILHKALPPKGEPVQTTTLSSWLRLWFCAELWQAIDVPTERKEIPPLELSRLYCDLTYVVRESLRGMLYGDRAEFRFQPTALAAALRTLVEQHAVWVLGLPQAIELWGILREIGGINLGGGPFYAAGHLQHVLEMYICGSWICAIKMNNQGAPDLEGASIRQILAGGGAWRPAEGKQIEFQRAFGLAVLLHDIGTLLFPFWPRRAEGLANIDGAARKRLKAIRSALDQSVEQLLVTCERELVEAGIFDPAKESKVHEWIDECIEQGQADHSVLGAWYLVRVAKSAPSLQSSVVRQAARAILFHGINTQEIRTEEDPVAALLVLCDELIVWRQSHEPPTPSEAGRYIHSMSSELRPEESIFLALGMRGLDWTLDPAQEGKPARLSFTLDSQANQGSAPPESKTKTWPVIRATLRQPDRLPTSVYKLWLLTSQNLGRIVPLSQIKFGPVLHLTSKIPSRHPELSIREIFSQVVPRADLSLRPCLQRWLARYPAVKSEEEESATCGPARPFCERRLTPLFRELERLVEAVVQEEILRNQEPPRPYSPLSDSTG